MAETATQEFRVIFTKDPESHSLQARVLHPPAMPGTEISTGVDVDQKTQEMIKVYATIVFKGK